MTDTQKKYHAVQAFIHLSALINGGISNEIHSAELSCMIITQSLMDRISQTDPTAIA